MAALAERPLSSTFRDPAGSLQISDAGVFRTVRPAYVAATLAFLNSDLCADLTCSGSLIASEVVGPAAADGSLRLRHPLVKFRSFPGEWSPAMWRAAATRTLSLCAHLVRNGWILKDGSPLNVLFDGPRPIFVDVLSIQQLDPAQPLWFGYGQFVRTFLLPLLAHAQLGWPLQAALLRPAGYEPEEIYASMPWSRRWRRPALHFVTLPSLLTRRSAANAIRRARPTAPDLPLVQAVVGSTLRKLQTAVQRTRSSRSASEWSVYAEQSPHYAPEDHERKQEFVRGIIVETAAARVLDIGCNTGVYAHLAADTGAAVVAIDTDLPALEQLYDDAVRSGRDILPLYVDFGQPTPAAGWANRECPSFLDRCQGHFDTVLMLAVLHHLLLRSQVPLEEIAAIAHRITTRTLIVEWVPPTDPKFSAMLLGREEFYAHITEQAFRNAFAAHFDTLAEERLQNGRILFHLDRR